MAESNEESGALSPKPESTPILSTSEEESGVSTPVVTRSNSTSITEKDVTDEKKEFSEHPNPTSVIDYGVCADQNWKYRRRMEDAHQIVDGFNGDETQGFFAVYDGHGGKEAALFAADNLHKILADEINKDKSIYEDPAKFLAVLRKTYLDTDSKLKTAVPSHHGCTSVTCIVVGKGENRHLYTANVGDARAVLARGGTAVRLTEEHKASDEIEAKRITDGGGFIIHGRVNGQIIITRSLGDHLMKEYIIGDPYMTHEKLTEKDNFLIVACDGLWDVIEDQQAVDFVLEHGSLSASEISKKLLIKALLDGTTDNLSIMVIKL